MTGPARVRRHWRRIIREVSLPLGAMVILAVLLLPVYFTLVASLEPSSTLQALPLTLFPHHLVLGNYTAAVQEESGSIATSLAIGVGTVLVSLAIGVPAAYGLMKYGLLNGRLLISVTTMVLLVTQMVPGISLSLAFYNLFRHLHLLNSVLGLVLADSTTGVPFAVLVIRAYMGSIPTEIMDAAYVDGCGEWRSFRSVIAPLTVPGIVTAALFVFIFAWGDFLFAYTLTTGGGVTPLTTGIFRFYGVENINYGPVLASVIYAAIPAGIMLMFAQRYITGGLRAGALKG
ncbi:MAG TPA: carbohydrate ABC transporter permease [Acidimicrobiales bacterium]|nr:carbohydrate ABC transporter permease [Acidimicrobiales bacterium]